MEAESPGVGPMSSIKSSKGWRTREHPGTLRSKAHSMGQVEVFSGRLGSLGCQVNTVSFLQQVASGLKHATRSSPPPPSLPVHCHEDREWTRSTEFSHHLTLLPCPRQPCRTPDSMLAQKQGQAVSRKQPLPCRTPAAWTRGLNALATRTQSSAARTSGKGGVSVPWAGLRGQPRASRPLSASGSAPPRQPATASPVSATASSAISQNPAHAWHEVDE
jgi:hypothetical protein